MLEIYLGLLGYLPTYLGLSEVCNTDRESGA